MKVVSVLDPVTNADNDCTVFILRHAIERGHDVWCCSPQSLFLERGVAHCEMSRLLSVEGWQLDEALVSSFGFADLVLMRQDPPFDINYITNTYILERSECLVVNDPIAIRNNPEKLFGLDDLFPPTLVSSQLSQIKNFCSRYHNVVLKPLYNCGGKGIMLLEGYKEEIIKRALNADCAPVVLQKFCDVSHDKRVVLLNGEIMGAYARVPAKGDFRANISQGGQPIATNLTQHEISLCMRAGAYAKHNKLFLVGLDILDGYITEMNVTSPMGLIELYNLYGIKSHELCWNFLETLL